MNIEHEFVVGAAAEKVFSCFSTAEGLNAWWTKTAVAEPAKDGKFSFGFGPQHQWSGIARIFNPNQSIEFQMTQTRPMDDWQGTRVGAVLTAENGGTRLHFYHRDWATDSSHFRVTSFCWATYLRLLAIHVVTGVVVPYERRLDIV